MVSAHGVPGDVDGSGAGPPQRPLPPPPTVREVLEIVRQRFALRHPTFDATRALLVVAALAGVAGMAWAVFGGGSRSGSVAPVAVAVSTSSAPSTTLPTTTSSVEPTFLIVDVAGAVHRPGPVRIRAGDRVADALEAAGGARADADLERVDRAAQLADGQRVYVPRHGQTDIPEVVGATGASAPGRAATDATGSPTGTGASTSPVDVNTADATALETLPGVGPATAAAIIDHRRAHGRFTSVDQLLEVKGIGPAKMAKLRPYVTV